MYSLQRRTAMAICSQRSKWFRSSLSILPLQKSEPNPPKNPMSFAPAQSCCCCSNDGGAAKAPVAVMPTALIFLLAMPSTFPVTRPQRTPCSLQRANVVSLSTTPGNGRMPRAISSSGMAETKSYMESNISCRRGKESDDSIPNSAFAKRNKMSPSVDPWYLGLGNASATGFTATPFPRTVPTACEKARACTLASAAFPDPLTSVPSTSKVMSVNAAAAATPWMGRVPSSTNDSNETANNNMAVSE
mmetsp:Transcript_33758/g.51779  ORF Transcript_33758/g.51779 Transcript_33758/m.51779 type:complete len:246 (-) Transcript_33758:22-759(-)